MIEKQILSKRMVYRAEKTKKAFLRIICISGIGDALKTSTTDLSSAAPSDCMTLVPTKMQIVRSALKSANFDTS